MRFIGILFALVYAALLVLLFAKVFRNTGPWKGPWVFFFLVFLVALGAGEWAAPVGPVAWGYYWVPGLVAGAILALVLAAVGPVSRSLQNVEESEHLSETDKGNEEPALVVTVFFWLLVLALLILAAGGIIWHIFRGHSAPALA